MEKFFQSCNSCKFLLFIYSERKIFLWGHKQNFLVKPWQIVTFYREKILSLVLLHYFLTAKLVMLQVNNGSNSIIDFVFGHFSLSFIFSSTPFIVFFYAFFAAIFSWKIQHQFIFSFESQENIF